jgi:hypothetical protein
MKDDPNDVMVGVIERHCGVDRFIGPAFTAATHTQASPQQLQTGRALFSIQSIKVGFLYFAKEIIFNLK